MTKGSGLYKLVSRIGDVQLCRGSFREPYGVLSVLQPECTTLTEKPDADPQAHMSGKITFTFAKEILRPDFNYAICVQVLSNPIKGRFSCQPFYVTTPFFASSTGAVNRCGDFDADPFLVRKINGNDVVVFGVLDPDLQNQIGRLNYGWWNSNEDYETTVQIADPAASLKQAMMRCESVPQCKNATQKVLLAQMPAYKATQLAGKVDTIFDLVVAATDPVNNTGDTKLRRVMPDALKGANYVVTPDEIYSGGKVTYNVQKATVERIPDTAPSTKVTWTLRNLLPPPPDKTKVPPETSDFPIAPPAPGSPSLRSAARDTLIALGVKGSFKNWSTADLLQRLALLVMQQDQHADISMLQSRDLLEPESFGPAAVSAENLQELLDRVFWKNDFAVRIPATGATITAVLSTSSDFDTQDSNPLNADPEKGRSIVSLGVFKEGAETNLAVNGSLLDPAKLYSVTLTDFLAVGDTGYPQFKTPAVPFPYRIKDFKWLHSISASVCRAIKKRVGSLKDAKCLGGALDAEHYLDTSKQLPPDTNAGFTQRRQTRAYLDPWLRVDRFKRFYEGQNDAEQLSAQKTFWSLAMEKGELRTELQLSQEVRSSANPDAELAEPVFRSANRGGYRAEFLHPDLRQPHTPEAVYPEV